MEEIFSIDEVSKVFNVPKSTLRYWESEKLISATRNQTSNYRQYNIKDLIDIGDIVFYRKLNIAIKQLKKINQMNATSIAEALEHKKQDLQQQIASLEKTIQRIDQSLAHIEEYHRLKIENYQLGAADIKNLVAVGISENEEIRMFVEDTYHSVILFKEDAEPLFALDMEQPGNGDIILQEKDVQDKKFVICLMSLNSENVAENNLALQKQKIRQQGYQLGELILGKYLISATEVQESGKQDFYKLWVEVVD